jgi:hypothetical protein
MKMEESIPKRRNIKFRHGGITQKKTYNIQNTAKVWNQEFLLILSFHLSRCPPQVLFPLSFPAKIQYKLLNSPIRATFPIQLILLDSITIHFDTNQGNYVYWKFEICLQKLQYLPLLSKTIRLKFSNRKIDKVFACYRRHPVAGI